MMLVLRQNGASALTEAWVRIPLFVLMEMFKVEESRRVRTSEEANLADVRAASRGDGEAYRRIIERYQQLMARRMLRFTRDPRFVEELVHDVFVEAYFSLPSYRGDAPFEHWLQRIATRVGYRYWTADKRERGRLDLQTYEPAASGDETILEAMDAVGVALAKLPPRDRLVLTLLYLESRSVAEAADLAGWSESMVKVQAHRARKKLRTILEAAAPAVTKGD